MSAVTSAALLLATPLQGPKLTCTSAPVAPPRTGGELADLLGVVVAFTLLAEGEALTLPRLDRDTLGVPETVPDMLAVMLPDSVGGDDAVGVPAAVPLPSPIFAAAPEPTSVDDSDTGGQNGSDPLPLHAVVALSIDEMRAVWPPVIPLHPSRSSCPNMGRESSRAADPPGTYSVTSRLIVYCNTSGDSEHDGEAVAENELATEGETDPVGVDDAVIDRDGVDAGVDVLLPETELVPVLDDVGVMVLVFVAE